MPIYMEFLNNSNMKLKFNMSRIILYLEKNLKIYTEY